MVNNKKSVIAIIGGGRWGRVTLSVLAEIKNIPFDEIIIISKYTKYAINESIEKLQKNDVSLQMPITVMPDLQETFEKYAIKAAIIANEARKHFETASILLDYNIPLLIEKPLTLTLQETTYLLKKAEKNSLSLIPGLNYRFCSYIENFSKKIIEQNQKINHFLIEWNDAAGEKRYGENKHYDASINVAQDVMPHIWTILFELFKSSKIEIQACRIENEGLMAEFTLKIDDFFGKVIIARNSLKRKRKITLGSMSILDFTVEPGIMIFGEEEVSADISWDQNPKPLMRQINYFLSVYKDGVISTRDIEACLGSVSFTEKASYYLEQCKCTELSK